MKAGEKVYFVLALHNHQPVGNLPHVFEENFKIAYEPFVEVLERFPNIKVGMHYTGSLLEWIEENRPDFIDRLRGLVARGQVEILGGAYYEPILPIIPDEDKIEQIRFMSQRLEELLGTRPRGCGWRNGSGSPTSPVPSPRRGWSTSPSTMLTLRPWATKIWITTTGPRRKGGPWTSSPSTSSCAT